MKRPTKTGENSSPFMTLWNRLLGKPNKEEFAKIMIRALKDAGHAQTVEYDAREFKLVRDSGYSFYLNNAYTAYLTAPRNARPRLIREYALGAVAVSAPAPMPGLEDALPDLLPSVRAKAFYGLTELRVKNPDQPILNPTPTQPIADHLAVSVVYDSPTTMRYVTKDQLSTWNISFSDALEAARDNLWKRGAGPFVSPAPGVYLASWHDNYDSSRLFLYDMIWHLKVYGDHVAAVPNRETLIVTGSKDIDGLSRLAQMCESLRKTAHGISVIPVTLQDKDWVPFAPGRDHPLYERFKKLRIEEQYIDYSQQKDLLEALYQKTGEDVFVASYKAFEDNNTHALTSLCVWTEGVLSLLPQADEIICLQPDNNGEANMVARAAWDRVYAVAGHLMTQLDMEPKRFKVEQFPSPAEIAEIGNASSDGSRG
jgi:hypothetical protein